MKKSLFILLTVLLKFVTVFSQNNQKQITELNFPYNEGYELELKGSLVLFDKYNFPKESVISGIQYKFTQLKGKNIKQVAVVQYAGKDSIKTDKTFLVLDEKGMYWWGEGKKGDAFDDKHKTLDLALPLFPGKKWKTYLQDIKTEYTCTTIDTIIETPVGKLPCIGIEYLVKSQETKEYILYNKVKSYYCQTIGRVYSVNLTYALIKSNNRIMKLSEETEAVIYYTGYKKEEQK